MGNCPAAQATLRPLYGNLAGTTSSDFPHASRVSRRSWCLSRAAARGCVKTPKSPIAFPQEAGTARLQSTLAPLPCQSAQAPRDRSPPARLFTQSGEVLGGASVPTTLTTRPPDSTTTGNTSFATTHTKSSSANRRACRRSVARRVPCHRHQAPDGHASHTPRCVPLLWDQSRDGLKKA